MCVCVCETSWSNRGNVKEFKSKIGLEDIKWKNLIHEHSGRQTLRRDSIHINLWFTENW